MVETSCEAFTEYLSSGTHSRYVHLHVYSLSFSTAEIAALVLSLPNSPVRAAPTGRRKKDIPDSTL